MSSNVQRLATRRQHKRPSAMHRSTLPTARPIVSVIGAVYPGARVAREAPTIVLCDDASRLLTGELLTSRPRYGSKLTLPRAATCDSFLPKYRRKASASPPASSY